MKKQKIKKPITEFSAINSLFGQFHQRTENKKKSLEQAIKKIGKIFKADGVALWIVEEKTQFMKIAVALGLSDRYLRYFNKTDRIRVGHGIVGRVIQQGETILSQHPAVDERIELIRWREIIQEEGICSFLSTPMFIGLEKIGTLNIYYKQSKHHFTPQEIELTEIFAYHFALFFAQDIASRQQESTHRELTEYRKRILKLRDVTEFLSLGVRGSFKKALERIVKQTLSDFGGSGIAIFQEKNKKLILVECYGFSAYAQQYLDEYPLQIDLAVSGDRVFTTKQLQISSRVLTDEQVPKFWKTLLANEGFVGEYIFPLEVRNNPVGILTTYYRQEHVYSQEEFGVLDTIAHFLAISLENFQIFLSLQEKINELERFYKLTVGREMKMIELKKEIKGLKKN